MQRPVADKRRSLHLVIGRILRIIARHFERKRQSRLILTRQRELQVVTDINRRTELEWFCAARLATLELRQIERRKRNSDFQFLAGPIEKVVLRNVEFNLKRFIEISRVRSLDIGDFTFDTNTDAEIKTEILPVALRRATKCKPHVHLCVATEKHASVNVQLAEIVNCAFYRHCFRR